MLAEKMNGGKVQGPSAGHAPPSLEDDGLGPQLEKFLLFAFRLGVVTGYQATVLYKLV